MSKTVRVAILDLYAGQPNQGVRCIREILTHYSAEHQLNLSLDEFEVRINKQIPGTDYDIYISTGGPGSPVDSKGTEWENLYFGWIKRMEGYNKDPLNTHKKHILFICHSFQLACRYFEVANVVKRKSTSFGVFPVHLTKQNEPAFRGLNDPFYAIDNRNYQVIEPDHERLEKIGASILAIEKERPHVPLERAVMAIRFNNYMLGTQFHPEVDPASMVMDIQHLDKKDTMIENIGYEKWQSMISQLNDPEKIKWTYAHVIPNFLNQALSDGTPFDVIT